MAWRNVDLPHILVVKQADALADTVPAHRAAPLTCT